MSEYRAKLSSGSRSDLPDSAFAYVEPGKPKKNGKTEDKYRHYPIHDKAHVQKALQLKNSPFFEKAKSKILAAAKRHGVDADGDSDGRSLESLFPEVRYIADRPEVRSVDGESGTIHTISGYAAVFNKVSRRLGNFHEKVMPTAFVEALRGIQDGTHPDVNIVCRYNHKDDMLLGTTLAGTLRLNVDERGLHYDVDPPNCRADVLEYVDRGDVRYSSFAFRVPEPGTDDTWSESEYGLPMRSLHNVELVDVAPVLDPAYKDTSASARNLAGAIESLASWVDADPTEVRSFLEAGQASKFFRRSDRSSVPVVAPAPAAEREESRVLDDPAISIRSVRPEEEPAPEGDSMVDEDDRSVRTEDEIRAAKGKEFGQICRKYTQGEPCVRPAGHDGNEDGSGCKGLCWGRHNGLPCNQEQDHEGPHTPVRVDSRSEEGEPAEERNEEPPAPVTLTGPEAMARMFERKKALTALPED